MKVFCWDFDGTLTRSASLWGGSIFDILKDVVPGISHERCQKVRESMWGGYPWDTPERDDGTCRGEAWWAYVEERLFRGCIASEIPPATAREAAARLRPTVKQLKRYALYGDAAFTLREIRLRGAKNVLLSNNYPDLWEVVEGLALAALFDGAVVSGEVGYNKPRGEIFALAKEKFPGAEFYMVGDNLFADVLGGKKSGMKTVLVHREISGEADYCFGDLKSVLALAET